MTVCGLTGIAIGKSYSGPELVRVKELFTSTLLAHQERGREATGVAAFWPDGRYALVKMPLPAEEFIHTPEYRQFLENWDPDVCTLLGHTRKPTKGSKWNPDNNHPVVVGHTLGIHNGTIDNDDHLYLQEKMVRRGQVDSEVIFSLLDQVRPGPYTGKKNFVAQVQGATQKLAGSFTTISVDLRQPRRLLLLKYNQPLSYHYSKSLDTLFFTSRYIFLRKAFGRAVVTEALQSKTAYIFDLSTNSVPRGQSLCRFPILAAQQNAAAAAVPRGVPA